MSFKWLRNSIVRTTNLNDSLTRSSVDSMTSSGKPQFVLICHYGFVPFQGIDLCLWLADALCIHCVRRPAKQGCKHSVNTYIVIGPHYSCFNNRQDHSILVSVRWIFFVFELSGQSWNCKKDKRSNRLTCHRAARCHKKHWLNKCNWTCHQTTTVLSITFIHTVSLQCFWSFSNPYCINYFEHVQLIRPFYSF